MSLPQPVIPPAARAPRRTERLWDAGALLLMSGGSVLFFLARAALQAIAAGTYEFPAGASAVARTDLLVWQSQAGVWLVAAGLAVGIYSTLANRARRLRGAPAPGA